MVFAGVSAAYAPSEAVKEKAEELGLQLLTKEESLIVNKALSQLDYMLKAADVPCLSRCFAWLIDNKDRYESYTIHNPERISYCYPEESVYLVVKY